MTTKRINYELTFSRSLLAYLLQTLDRKLRIDQEETISNMAGFFAIEMQFPLNEQRFLSELFRTKADRKPFSLMVMWYDVKAMLNGDWQRDVDIIRIGKKYNFVRTY